MSFVGAVTLLLGQQFPASGTNQYTSEFPSVET